MTSSWPTEPINENNATSFNCFWHFLKCKWLLSTQSTLVLALPAITKVHANRNSPNKNHATSLHSFTIFLALWENQMDTFVLIYSGSAARSKLWKSMVPWELTSVFSIPRNSSPASTVVELSFLFLHSSIPRSTPMHRREELLQTPRKPTQGP